MKKTLLIFAAAVMMVFGSSAFGQSDRMVENIQAEVARIDKNGKGYAATKKNVDGISLEGTEATYYTSGNDLKKIVAKVYGETYNANVDLYYSDGKLIYAYQKLNRYESPVGSSAAPKVAKTEDHRLYFSGGRLMRFMIKTDVVSPTAQNFTEKENEVGDLSDKLVAAFRK